MPRVTLRTVEPAKLLACQSVEKRCTRWKASGRDVGHHLQRQVDDRDEGDMPEHDRAEQQARSSVAKAAMAASQIDRVARGAAGDRVDQPARIERRQHVGQRREQHGRHDDGQAPRLMAPVARE